MVIPLVPWTKQSGLKWFVLHTKSRQEKALVETLQTLQVEHYLPLTKQVKHYGSRKAKVELPLFPGYVFLHGTLEHAYEADRTKRVANILHVADQIALEEELTSIYIASSYSDKLDPYPYLKRNVRVQVISGPLRGVRGVIEDRTKRDRLILQINVLGQATSLEIDGSLLEVVE